jgi:hypothetical protein
MTASLAPPLFRKAGNLLDRHSTSRCFYIRPRALSISLEDGMVYGISLSRLLFRLSSQLYLTFLYLTRGHDDPLRAVECCSLTSRPLLTVIAADRTHISLTPHRPAPTIYTSKFPKLQIPTRQSDLSSTTTFSRPTLPCRATHPLHPFPLLPTPISISPSASSIYPPSSVSK